MSHPFTSVTYVGFPVYSIAIGHHTSDSKGNRGPLKTQLEEEKKEIRNSEKDQQESSANSNDINTERYFVVVGGGGGPGRSGVKNKLAIYSPETDPSTGAATWRSNSGLKEITHYDFQSNEDAVMSVAMGGQCRTIVAGVNPSEDSVKEGKDVENLRILQFQNNKLELKGTKSTIETASVDDFQRLALFSPNEEYIGCGATDGNLSIMKYSSFEHTSYSPIKLDSEIFDLAWDPSSSFLVATCENQIIGYNISNGEEVFKVQAPKWKGKSGDFRAGQFSKTNGLVYFYTFENFGTKCSCITKWKQSEKGWVAFKRRQMASNRIVSCSISTSGEQIAVGTSDCSVHIISTSSLRTLHVIQKLHGMPVTSMAFSPDASILVTTAIDGFIKCTSMQLLKKSSLKRIFGRFITLFVIIAALLSGFAALGPQDQVSSVFNELNKFLPQCFHQYLPKSANSGPFTNTKKVSSAEQSTCSTPPENSPSPNGGMCTGGNSGMPHAWTNLENDEAPGITFEDEKEDSEEVNEEL